MSESTEISLAQPDTDPSRNNPLVPGLGSSISHMLDPTSAPKQALPPLALEALTTYETD
jgi:hypothetical protein